MTPAPCVHDADFSLVERLARLPYFAALAPDRLAILVQRAVCRRFGAQEMLFGQDEPSAGLWIIERGEVKIYRLSTDGREHIVHLFGPGDSFNEIPALDGGPNPVSATALSELVAWVLPADVLQAEIRADPNLALAVIDILAGRMRLLVQQIDDLALCSVTTRLARFLLKQATDPVLSAPAVTRATIAAHLATTPETVSRALRTLEEIGALRFDRHEIIIDRADLLRSVAME